MEYITLIEPCPDCKGTRKDDKGKPCKTCLGTGERHQRVSLDALAERVAKLMKRQRER